MSDRAHPTRPSVNRAAADGVHTSTFRGTDLEELYISAVAKDTSASAVQKQIRSLYEQIIQVLDAADHPVVGTLYDPCNYYRHGHDPLSALKDLGRRVYYCHLKDAWFPYPARQPEAPPMAHSGQVQSWWWIRPLGEGNVGWGPILSELATFYEGYMCLEHDIRDSVMWGTRIGIGYVRRMAAELNITVEF